MHLFEGHIPSDLAGKLGVREDEISVKTMISDLSVWKRCYRHRLRKMRRGDSCPVFLTLARHG